MTKTQKVKVNKENVKEQTEEIKLPKELDTFFERLKKEVEDTASKLGLTTKEPHDYYIVYVYEKEGKTTIGHSSFTSNLNPYAKHGYGLMAFAQKVQMEKDIKSEVHVLNVIKLED